MFDLNIAPNTDKTRIEFSLKPKYGFNCKNSLNYIAQAFHIEPLKYKSFPNVSSDILIRLEAIGIENTLQLYEEVLTPECRRDFALKTGVSEKDVLILTKYADLSRMGFLNPAVIYAFVEIGFDTVEKLSKSEPKVLYHAIKYFGKEKKDCKFEIKIDEICLIIEIAKYLKKEIEY